jgi:exonuclease III
LKSESERGSGPKISTLRVLTRTKIDFLVLTETRVDVRAVRKIKLKRNLHATMQSLHPRPRGGVIVFSKKEHKLIPDSVRTSQSPGHFAVGVYEIGATRVIVAGVYGCSESGDRPSLEIIHDLRDRLQELSHVFQTRTVVLAGDFNATLSPADANNHNINKPTTVQALLALMEDHQLVDLGAHANCLEHTWHRRDSSGQSSRIDLILTNIPMQRRRYNLTQTIFDHAFLHGSINSERRQVTQSMKDFVLGSEEFLIHS